MTSADYVIVIVCVSSALVGLWRGFTREALSLLTLLAAIWIAWRFAPFVEPRLGEFVGVGEARIWAARAVLFIGVLIVGGVVAWLARKLIGLSGLSGVDRLLGAGFGLLRAAVIVGLGVMALEYAGLDQDAWWQQARLKPYADRAATAVKYYAALGSRYFQEPAAV